MAIRYRPITPFNVAMILLIPSEAMVKGVLKKVYPDPETDDLSDYVFNGSFRTFGGTE